MAKTLFLVKDSLFQSLPQRVLTLAIAETKKLFGFVPLTIAARESSAFPSKIDFSDSIVKIVETDDELTATQNHARRTMILNMSSSIRQHKVALDITQGTRSAANPERGGVGWHWKVVTKEGGGKLVAISETGGLASLEAVKSDVLEAFAGGSRADLHDDKKRAMRSAQKASSKATGALAGHPILASARYAMSADSLKHARGLLTWELEGKALNTWPETHQSAVGVALARLIAHEARHQYLTGHSSSGLGAGEAVLWGQSHFEEFEQGDKKLIANAIWTLETKQKTADVHLEALPRGQRFPF